MLWSVLNLQTKMVAMFGCAIIIALSILIIICFLIPDSWWILPWAPHQADEDQALNEPEGSDVRLRDFHQWRPEDEDHPAELMDSRNKSKKPSSSSSRLSRNELCYDSSGYSVDSGRPGSLLTGGRESSLSSNGSSVVSSPSTSSSRSGSTTTLGAMTDEPGNRPQVHLTLQTHVVGQSDDVKNGAAAAALDLQLIVTIENATDLPSRTYVDTVDPSVSVRLERRSRLGSLMGALIGSSNSGGRRNSNSSHHQVVTEDSTCPVVYHSRHPRFHHLVTLAVPKSTQLKDCQLVVRVEDKDKLVGTTELGESRIDLRELDLLAGWLEGNGGQRSAGAGGESTVRLSRFIDIFKAEEKGAVLLGLSFLPTSQRITVHITQCNRLAKTADSAAHNKAVVRLFLLNESGRVLKKRKTAPFDPNGGRVELDELFHLDVEIERWDRCVILIVLSRIVSSTEVEQTTTTMAVVRSPPVYQHSGHVALGKRVLGHAERIHWNSAFQSPRRVISQWHGLH